MKNSTFFFLSFLIFTGSLYSQINTYGTPNNALVGENAFMDASSNFDYSVGSNTEGKGLVFPRTNLTTWSFNTGSLDGIFFPSYFDGMIVYNSATGNTLTDDNTGNNPTLSTAVTPGFYYFSNPSGAANGNITAGVWTALGGGSGASKEVTSTESTSGLKVNGAQVYSITGTFEASGSSTAVSVTVPAGMTGYYSMVTYKDGKTFRSTIYSFDIASSTNNVICGTGVFSEVLPAGTYSYVLEYFK